MPRQTQSYMLWWYCNSKAITTNRYIDRNYPGGKFSSGYMTVSHWLPSILSSIHVKPSDTARFEIHSPIGYDWALFNHCKWYLWICSDYQIQYFVNTGNKMLSAMNLSMTLKMTFLVILMPSITRPLSILMANFVLYPVWTTKTIGYIISHLGQAQIICSKFNLFIILKYFSW